MLQRIFGGLTVFFLAFLIIGWSPARAQEAVAETSTQVLEIDSIADGPHFFADSRLVLPETYQGSVYAAGGEVRLTGTVEGDLVIAGGSVIVDGTVLDDIYVVGGTVIINGEVGGNVTAAGGEVRLSPSAQVMGNVIGAARTYIHQGSALGDVMVGAKLIRLEGSVGQSARFEVDELNVTAQAEVGENLQAEVRRQSSVSEAAQINGETDVSVKQQTNREQKMSPVNWSARWLLGIVGRVIVISIILAVFGGYIKKAANVFDRRWPDALWKGAAFAVLVPMVLITLLLTVIGAPAALLLGLLYLLIMCTAWVVPGFWLGRLLVPKVSVYAQGAIGAAIISLVTFIPIFGWVIRLLLAVLGAGALIDVWRKSK